MELIIKNQPTIYDDTLYKYLTPKQCIKFYSSNKILYNIYVYNNRFKYYYFTPINNTDLIDKVGLWYDHREDTILEYGHISFWNTINITNMASLFADNYNFNDNISDWDTTHVFDMSNMFENCIKFNQNLNSWNINKLCYIDSMFINAFSFDKNNISSWNYTNNFNSMFNNNINNNYTNKYIAYFTHIKNNILYGCRFYLCCYCCPYSYTCCYNKFKCCCKC